MDQARGSKFVIPQSNRQATPTNLNGLVPEVGRRAADQNTQSQQPGWR